MSSKPQTDYYDDGTRTQAAHERISTWMCICGMHRVHRKNKLVGALHRPRYIGDIFVHKRQTLLVLIILFTARRSQRQQCALRKLVYHMNSTRHMCIDKSALLSHAKLLLHCHGIPKIGRQMRMQQAK